MTPTTNERDRFEAWAKDTMSLVKEPGGYKEATTHHAWRAWQAALTREQREGDESKHADAMRFYGVDSLDALIEAQSEHVERLQEKLPRDNQPAFTRVREG